MTPAEKLRKRAEDLVLEVHNASQDSLKLPRFKCDVELIEAALTETRNEARLEAIEEALQALENGHPHSSGCGQIFGWPFTKELIDGRCNCGVLNTREMNAIRSLIAPKGDV